MVATSCGTYSSFYGFKSPLLWESNPPSPNDIAHIKRHVKIYFSEDVTINTLWVDPDTVATFEMNGHKLVVNGNVSVNGDSTLLVSGGSMVVYGSINSDRKGKVELNGASLTTGYLLTTVKLEGDANNITVTNVGRSTGAIIGLRPEDRIHFPNDTWNTGIQWVHNPNGSYSVYDEYSTNPNDLLIDNVWLAPGVTPSDFSWDQKTGTIVCFLTGTLIETDKGLIAVESLSKGMMVKTIQNKTGAVIYKPIVWIGKRHVVPNPASNLKPDEAGYPVCIKAHAIKDNVPFQDLKITSEHCLAFPVTEDELSLSLIPARMLVNNRSIFYDKDSSEYTCYHIETEEHSIIVSNGMMTESYLDTGNRDSFSEVVG